MRNLLAVVIVLSCYWQQAGGQSARDQLAELLGRPVVVGLPEEFGILADAVVRPDGSVCVVDSSNSRVTCFSPDGLVVLRTGRSGQGPGEFQLPILIASDSDGNLHVLDKVGDLVTCLTKDGTYLRRVSLELRFLQVTGMLVQANSDFIVTGYLGRRGLAGDSGVHVFTASGRYVRSFGPLPGVRDVDALRYWGTGWLGRVGKDSLLYSPKYPYRLYLYGPREGPTLVDPGIQLSAEPPEPFVITKEPVSTKVMVSTKPVMATGPVVFLGEDTFLSQRMRTVKGQVTGGWVDVIRKGKVVTSMQVPAHLEGLRLVGVDRARGVLWGIATDDDRPVLVRLTGRMLMGGGRDL